MHVWLMNHAPACVAHTDEQARQAAAAAATAAARAVSKKMGTAALRQVNKCICSTYIVYTQKKKVCRQSCAYLSIFSLLCLL